jgi:hypothetical protein
MDGNTHPPASRLATMVAGWNRFWFTPGDPTVLGAIRIITGAIAVYTLFLYGLDLQELMGENAWVDLQSRQDVYQQAPVPARYLTWDEFSSAAPTTDEERSYQTRYVLKYGRKPPAPYPQSAEEEKKIDDYIERWGTDPRTVVERGRPFWSVWFHVVDPFWMYVVYTGMFACSVMFLFGYATRLTSVLTWFTVLSNIHRDPASLFGVDTMMVVLLMYLAIGPSGAALSVDRWLECRRARQRGLPEPALEPSVSATLAVRLIQVHLCIIYLSAGLAKLQGPAWWQGTAPWGTMANYEYAPMHLPMYVDLLRLLAKHRWLYELSMTAAAITTLAFEIGYPFLIWPRSTRNLMLWYAVALHLGIGLLMGLRTFSLLMLAFNVAFVSPTTVRWAVERILRQGKRDQTAAPPPPEPTPPPAAAEPAKETSEAVVRQEKLVKMTTSHGKRKR